MREFLLIICIFIGMGILLQYCESKKDPYEVGSHWDYSIICEDGFKYKQVRNGIIPCKNSDGTLLKCNQERY
jgi:hypothetical protein